MINNFECKVCETEFEVDEYDDMDINKCPGCGQAYNYDEGLSIKLTENQIKLLKDVL